jgi:thiol-disulfide isomerase/thioredoxin
LDKEYLSNVKYKDYATLVTLFQDLNNTDSVIFHYTTSGEFNEGIESQKILDSLVIGKKLIFEKSDFLNENDFNNYNPNKPTFLPMWFINCAGCKQEIPYLNAFRKIYGNDYNIMALTFENKSAISKFLKTNEFDLIHLSNDKLIDELGDFAFPITFLLDSSQKVKITLGPIFDVDFDGYKYIFNHLNIGGDFKRQYFRHEEN